MSLNKYLIDFAEEHNLKKGLTFFNDFYNSQKKENSGNLVHFFLELFPSLPKSFLKELKVASNFYFFSVLAVDKIIDTKDSYDNEALLLSVAFREHSLHKMYQIIEPNSDYWIHFQKYYKQYLKALSIELNNRNGNFKDIGIKELEFLYSGNSALAKALPTAMLFKDGQEELLKTLEKSIDYYYIALNLFDDINDWKEDWKNGNYSYLIIKTIINNKLDISELSTKHLGHYIFLKQEASKCLELSLKYYEKAIHVLRETECKQWKLAIKSSMNKCINLKEDIELLVAKQLSIAGINTTNNLQSNIKFDDLKKLASSKSLTGLKYIINQWENGYQEVALHSFFPNFNGFEFNKRYYKADIFQRAVICDHLMDINQGLENSLSSFIDFEIEYLQKNIQKKGGWNFYEDFEFQPNDADTTAQVMQVLMKANKQNAINTNTIEAIDMLLDKQDENKGRICTWFLPPGKMRDSIETQQGKFLKEYTNHDFDKSNDIEVMANLLYSLALYDTEKYADSINLGIDFIEKHQNANGSWNSTWYWGEYYGTYVCLRLLSKIKPNSKVIVKAKEFLLNTKENSLGWGYKKNTDDPLNTALALISLCYLQELNYDLPMQKIDKACAYLENAILNNKELDKCDYINLRRQRFSSFKSNSVTISYALKALALWRNLQ